MNSSPKGAAMMDGRAATVTPLALTDLSAGPHTVTIASSAGSIEKNVRILAGGKMTSDEGIFSG